MSKIVLTCDQLKQALEFGAPNQGDEFQLSTEMAIEFVENGHSGTGYYCWYLDIPEAGSVFLGGN